MKAFIKPFGSISVTLERWVCINKTKTKSYQERKKEGREGGREGREKERARERKKTQYMSRFQILKSVSLDSNLLSVAPSSQYEAQDCLKMTLRISWLLRH